MFPNTTKFSDAEQVIINTIKAQLQTMIHTKQALPNGVVQDCVIAGGVFASLLQGERLKDIDVFILNNNVNVYNHYCSWSNGEKWTIRDAKDAPKYLDNPHIHGTAFNPNTVVQYILTDYTSRKELLDSFDYLHATVSFVPIEGKLYITRGAYDAICEKKLIPHNNNTPKYWRQEKFMKRGWKTKVIDSVGYMTA